MHESKILMKLNTCHEQDVDGADITVAYKINNYIIVIQFPPTGEIKNAKVVNVEKYGWGGVVADNYQNACRELNLAIQDSRKAKYIILHSHGGAPFPVDPSGKEIRNKRIVQIFTSHLDNRILIASYFVKLRRLNKEIPEEEKLKGTYYKERDQNRLKREQQRKLREEIRKGTANLPKEEIQKLKKEKRWKNNDNNTNGYYDDLREKEEDRIERENDEREYNNFKKDIEDEKIKINKIVNDEMKKDMESLKYMISCVEDNGYFVFASCNSAFNTDLLQEIRKYVNAKVNLVGIVLLAAYNRKEGTGGELDGNFLFSSSLDIYLAETKKSKNNQVVVISPDGTEAYFSNAKIDKEGLQFKK